MRAAYITDKNSLLLDVVTPLTICCTHVDIVFVVKATAYRVSFHNLITHDLLVTGCGKMAKRDWLLME